MQIFLYLINHFFFIFLVLSVGSFIFSKLSFNKATIQIKFSVGYFLGVMFLVTGTRLIDYMFNSTKISAFFVIFLSLIIIFFFLKN